MAPNTTLEPYAFRLVNAAGSGRGNLTKDFLSSRFSIKAASGLNQNDTAIVSVENPNKTQGNYSTPAPTGTGTGPIVPIHSAPLTDVPKPKESFGLSGIAIAGVALGSTFGTIGLIGLLLFLVIRRRQSKEKEEKNHQIESIFHVRP